MARTISNVVSKMCAICSHSINEKCPEIIQDSDFCLKEERPSSIIIVDEDERKSLMTQFVN